MELNLLHHVYSSLTGYKTLFTSPGVPRELVERAEALARRCYKLIGRRPLKAHYRPGPGWSAFVRGLQFGTDHVGRPRTCVHTIFLKDEETARIPYFTPFMNTDDLFIVDGADLQYLGQEVQQTWDIPEEELYTPSRILNSYHLSPDLLGKFIPAMLDTRRASLILDAGGKSFGFAGLISCFLPPQFRTTISFLDHAFVPPVEGGTNFQFNFFANRPDPSILEFSDWIILDIDRNEMHYPPMAPPYATFLLGALGSPAHHPDAVQIVGILETYERFRRLERGYLTKVVDAYKISRAAFHPDGRLAFEKNPGAAYDAIPDFAEAQCFNIVTAICKAILADVEARFAHKPDLVSTLRRDVDRLGGIPPGDPVQAHRVAMEVHHKTAPAYGREQKAPPPGIDDDDTLSLPGNPMARKARGKEDTTTMVAIPPPTPSSDTDLLNIPTISPFEEIQAVPVVEACPSCGLMTLTEEEGRKVCLNKKCTYKGEMEFDV